MKIVQISDLHLTGPHYVPLWGSRLITMVNEDAPDLLIVTGDLTQEGLLDEYQVAADYLSKIKVRDRLIVPGNHDASNAGYTVFEEFFKTRSPEYSKGNIFVLGIDSSEPDVDDGHVGRDKYPRIIEKLSDRTKTRILALHHHLIPIPGTGRERQIPVDSGDVLSIVSDLGVNYVLSGHKHRQWVWKLGETYFVTAGTACTRRFKGDSYPSYNILEINGKDAVLTEVNVRDETAKKVFNIKTR